MGYKALVLLHRYTGLTIASFLVIVSLTGSLLAFYEEIDNMLNPGKVFVAVQSYAMIDPLLLREQAQKLFPEIPLNYVPLHQIPGKTFRIWVDLPNQKYIYVSLNPYTAEEVFRLPTNYLPITRKNFMDVVYDLHWRLLMEGNKGVSAG